MSETVLVTGATGRLGRAVCAALAEAGLDVRGTDLCFRAEMPCRLDVADLLSAPAAYRLLAGCGAVVHLANHPNVGAGPTPQRVYTENVAMDANVFQAAVELGVKTLVFASSVQAFSGDRSLHWNDDAEEPEGLRRPSCLAYLPIDGDLPACPRNLYALSKEAGEQMLRYYAAVDDGLSATALRFPFLANDRMVRWHRRHRGEGKGRIRGNPDEGFSFLFLEDAGALVAALLAHPQPGYRCFCPAAPTPYLDVPIPELIETCYPGVPLRKPAEALTSLVDISALTEACGWRPKRTSLLGEE